MSRTAPDGWFEDDPFGTDFKGRAIRSGGITIFSQTLAYGVQTIGLIVMARILSPEDFGLVAFVSLVSLMLMNFGVKFSETIIQESAITHELVSNVFWANLAISLALGVVMVVLSPALSWFFRDARLVSVSAAMALMILAPAFSAQHTALLKRKMRFKAIAIIELGAAMVSVVVGIWLALRGYRYWSLVVRQLVLYFGQAAGAWLLCSWRPAGFRRIPSVARILRFTTETYGNYCMTYFSRSLGKILTGRFFGSTPLGNYDRASSLSSAFPNQMITPLSGVVVATLSRLRNDPDKFLRYYEKIISPLAFIGMGISMALTLAGKDLIILVLGPQWEEAGALFTALAAGMGITLVYATTTWIHITLGRADRAFKWSVLSLVASAVIHAVGLAFGPLGIAAAYSATDFVLAAPASRYAIQPLGGRRLRFARIVGKHVLAASVAGAVTWLIVFSSATGTALGASLGRPLRILVVLALSSLLYALAEAVLHTGWGPFMELIGILRELKPGKRPADSVAEHGDMV